MCHSTVSASFLIISAQNNLRGLAELRVDGVLRETFGGIPVEHKQKVSSLVNQHLVHLVLTSHILVMISQDVVLDIKCDHRSIEVQKPMVLQICPFCKIPSSPAVVIAPVVSLSREVNPLRMSELIPHEGKITLVAKRKGDQSNHLMQCHPAEYSRSLLIEDAHIAVNLAIEQPHRDGLISDQSLIVAFRIGNTWLLVPSIGQLEGDFSHLPVFILVLLQQLDPHVRNCHRHSEPKPYASFFYWPAESREAGDIFRDEDDLRIDDLGQLISNAQVSKRIDIQIMIEVFIVIPCETVSFAMVLIQHRGDSIETVSIGIVLLDPKPNVGQQKSQDFVFGVIEDSTVPKRMISLLSSVEVLIISAVPHVDPFQHILSSMRMHQIYNNLDPHSMRLVDQLLELTRRTKTRGNTEEVRAVVAKRSIVRMFYDSHNLNDIIPKILYPRQHIFPEITKRVHFLLNPRHAYMAFIHLNIHILPLWFLVLPLINTQVDVDSIKGVILILTCVIDPRGDAIHHASVFYLHLDLKSGEVRNGNVYFAGPQSELILHGGCLTLSQTYSPLFQPLNSPKMEIYCASGAHYRQMYFFPSRWTPQRLQLCETSFRPFSAWNQESF